MESSTKEFLIGTRNGLIFEAELEPTAELFKKEERYFKQVYSIQTNMPITGIRMEQFPVTRRKYYVIAVTPTRIYQFIGTVSPNVPNGVIGGSEDKAMFESLFSKYEVNPGKKATFFSPGAIKPERMYRDKLLTRFDHRSSCRFL